MAKQIGRRIEALKDELSKPIPEPLTTKEKTKMAKKTKKKGKKKSVKKTSAKKKDSGDLVLLKDLAEEAGIGGQAARQKLRAAGIEREEGKRWGWTPKSKALASVRKALGL